MHLNQVKLRIFHAVRFEEGNILEGRGLLEKYGLEARQIGGALKRGVKFRRVKLQPPGDSRYLLG